MLIKRITFETILQYTQRYYNNAKTKINIIYYKSGIIENDGLNVTCTI